MFDVASGECELVDFLLTRFNPLDLKTKINLSPSCRVDEQFAPKKEPEDEELQLPQAETEPARPQIFVADARDRLAREAELPSSGLDSVRSVHIDLPEGLDQVDTGLEEEEEQQPAVPTRGPDWLSLIEGFHAAAQRYQQDRLKEPDEDT
jgi:hypothetical protein